MGEEIKQIDGFEVLADFVEKYEIARELIGEGQLTAGIIPMGDLCMRDEILEKHSVDYPHSKIYGAHKMALTYMKGIFKAHGNGEDIPLEIFDSLDRLVSEVDIGMQGLLGEKWQKRLGRAS